MKRNRSLVVAVLALSLSWVGCNKSGKLSEPSASPAPSGPVELKLKWTDGEHILQQMAIKQTAEINIPSQPAPMKQDMQMGQDYALTVVKTQPDGGHEIEMEFLAARMKMSMNGKSMTDFDSAKKHSADKPDPMSDVFGKIVGAKIRYFLDASNNVDHLEGVDEMINRISAGNEAAAMPLKSMMNEGYFKQMMSQNRYLPTKPVQPGDSWPVQIDMPMGPIGTMSMDYTITFQNWEKHGVRNCARLDFQGTLKSKGPAKSKTEAVTISSLDGTLTGTSWFDPELGIIIDSAMKQDMTAVMSMNMGSTPQNMTTHMLQDLSIKLVSVK